MKVTEISLFCPRLRGKYDNGVEALPLVASIDAQVDADFVVDLTLGNVMQYTPPLSYYIIKYHIMEYMMLYYII